MYTNYLRHHVQEKMLIDFLEINIVYIWFVLSMLIGVGRCTDETNPMQCDHTERITTVDFQVSYWLIQELFLAAKII